MMVDFYLHPAIGKRLADILFPFKWIGLYFRPRYQQNQHFFRRESIFGAKHCRGVFVIDDDESVVRKVKTVSKNMVTVVPEATNENSAINEEIRSVILGKSKGRCVVGFLGNLTPTRGLGTFIELIKKADPERYFFVAAGPLPTTTDKHSPIETIQSLSRNPPENCLFLTRNIPDGTDFNTIVRACDIIYLIYRGFPHSSNVMTKAALFHKPVIVSEGKGDIMAEGVRRYSTGAIIPQEDVLEKSLESLRALAAGENQDGSKFMPDFEGYFAKHSQKRLSEILSEYSVL
jgi:glycosyltransferase involved in cell wall biosynthesis